MEIGPELKIGALLSGGDSSLDHVGFVIDMAALLVPVAFYYNLKVCC